MEIVVLGEGDGSHDGAVGQIGARFPGTRFAVRRHEIMDRAGYFSFGRRTQLPPPFPVRVREQGIAPLQHLAVTATGVCVLCYEDYDERWVVGDLRHQTVEEV